MRRPRLYFIEQERKKKPTTQEKQKMNHASTCCALTVVTPKGTSKGSPKNKHQKQPKIKNV